MSSYQVLVVEDEPAEADNLKSLLSRYGRERKIDLTVTRYETALPLVSKGRSFDLILMDINLPGISGMEAAQLLRDYDQRTPLVFVTNLAQYAVKGYEVNALDFIVKPVSYHGLAMRLDKVMRQIARNGRSSLVLQTRDGMRKVEQADLVYVDVSNHDLLYHLTGGDPVCLRQSLSKAAKSLEGRSFVRISNCCLINMDHIRALGDGSVRMSTGDTLYFSRSRKREAVDTIARYLGGSI